MGRDERGSAVVERARKFWIWNSGMGLGIVVVVDGGRGRKGVLGGEIKRRREFGAWQT